jgi:hypothetical protein
MTMRLYRRRRAVAAQVENEAEDPKPAPIGSVARAVKLNDGLRQLLLVRTNKREGENHTPLIVKHHFHVQIKKSDGSRSGFFIHRHTPSRICDCVDQFLIQIFGVLVSRSDWSYCIPRQGIQVPLVIKVLNVSEVHREFSVMSWRCEAIAPEVN